MKKTMKAVAALMLMTAVVIAAGCTKPDDPNNGGNNNGGDTPTTYAITLSANPANGGTVTGGGTYQEGQNCTVSATANSGYTFANWTENGSEVSTSESYTFAVAGERTLVANFISSSITYAISVSARPQGGGILFGGGIYQEGEICTVKAITANSDYTFDNWTENDSVVSDSESYTFTVTCRRVLVANFTYNGGNNGYAYVDLGLPSGTLWAICNVGADTPEGYGDYFAWGETQPKTIYDWITYEWCNGAEDQLTKYCNNSSYGSNGFTDNLITLSADDDAATANWGNEWCTPNKEQWEELLGNTSVKWETQNKVNGYLFISDNGRRIFLPAAGGYNGGGLIGVKNYGNYWSRSLCTEYPIDASVLYFSSEYKDVSFRNRNRGHSVRAVRSAK